jgi:hypothetical protein
MDRLNALKRIHVFSAASYAVLLYYAKELGQLRLSVDSIKDWNRANQRRHGILPCGMSLLSFVFKKAIRKDFVFSGRLLEEAMSSSVTEEFASRPVKDLSPNLRFWTYCRSDERFVAIAPDEEPLNHLPVARIVRTTANIPGVYEPFVYDGKEYSDAISVRGVGQLFRQLRQEAEKCLFLSMVRDGEDGNTTFARIHDSWSGKYRVFRDFVKFLAGVENKEFVGDLKRGLFRLSPLPPSIDGRSADEMPSATPDAHRQ